MFADRKVLYCKDDGFLQINTCFKKFQLVLLGKDLRFILNLPVGHFFHCQQVFKRNNWTLL